MKFPFWRQFRTGQSGLTLIELLGVAVILIFLALLAMPVYAKVTDKSRLGTSSSDLRSIEIALERYHADHGYYPTKLGTLVKESYLRNFAFKSPWSPDEEAEATYYFYATDRKDKPQAYILADPGPNAVNCRPGESEQNTDTLYQDPNKPFPCGRDPFKDEARNWSTPVGAALKFSPDTLTVTHPKNFRLTCDPDKKREIAQMVQCTFKADS